MLNGDPHLPFPTTEQIQKCLEENKDLILAILELQRQGKFAETAQYQAKLQYNLTFLAKLADVAPQEQMPSQGQGIQQPSVTMSRQRPDIATFNSPLDMNEQQKQHMALSLQQPDLSASKLPFQMNEQQLQLQQQQQHMALSLQQPARSASKLPFQMNEQQLQQQQQYRLPGFFQQHQFIPEAMANTHVTPPTNSGMQTRLFNLQDTPSINLMGSDVGPGWF